MLVKPRILIVFSSKALCQKFYNIENQLFVIIISTMYCIILIKGYIFVMSNTSQSTFNYKKPKHKIKTS